MIKKRFDSLQEKGVYSIKNKKLLDNIRAWRYFRRGGIFIYYLLIMFLLAYLFSIIRLFKTNNYDIIIWELFIWMILSLFISIYSYILFFHSYYIFRYGLIVWDSYIPKISGDSPKDCKIYVYKNLFKDIIKPYILSSILILIFIVLIILLSYLKIL